MEGIVVYYGRLGMGNTVSGNQIHSVDITRLH